VDTFTTPHPSESLASYVSRIRKKLNLTQFELADAAGIHGRSIGKIERGLTVKINRRTLQGLAIALGVPQEYLDAVIKGEEVSQVRGVKFCPQCWNPHSALQLVV
jgi:transcriptional regulator with XRE-family HTH domain